MKEDKIKTLKNIETKKRRITGRPFVFSLYSLLYFLDYLSKANLLATSVQLITLKKASI